MLFSAEVSKNGIPNSTISNTLIHSDIRRKKKYDQFLVPTEAASSLPSSNDITCVNSGRGIHVKGFIIHTSWLAGSLPGVP